MIVTSAAPALSQQLGIAARFGAMRAVVGKPLAVRVEVQDLRSTVARVEVTLRVRGKEETHRAEAVRPKDGADAWWIARFDASLIPAPPAWIELTARLVGARGGTLLEVGGIDPHELAVMTPSRAREERRVVQRTQQRVQESEKPLPLVAYVGLEGRAGSSARARVFVGAGAHVGKNLELGAGVSVGPAFAEPDRLAGGGPLVLGFDLALRGYAVRPRGSTFAPFLELFAMTDLRLPGVDPGGGLRAGVSILGGDNVRVDLALGGAAVVYGVSDDDPTVGFAGGLKAAVRLGDERSEDEEHP